MQSLNTEDRRTAERRAAVLKARWLSEIEQERSQSMDHLERDAEFWRRAVKSARSDEEREIILDRLDDELDTRTYRAAEAAGITDATDPAFKTLPERRDANRIYAIASGTLVRLDEHLEEYLGTVGNEPKTVDMKRSTIRKFCADFRCVEDVGRKDVQQWINREAQSGKKPKTIRRALSELRGYWKYLAAIQVAPDDEFPFERLSIPAPQKSGKADERRPFKPDDVVRLATAAAGRDDHDLADLIELAMWTGARIEELCALRREKVADDYFEVEDAKTAAGWRQVPIHSKLMPTLQHLMSETNDEGHDGYLLSGLSRNKYGDRSNAIGKRFGRLKTSLGFGPGYVFHSIRRTVATLFEDAGVAENVAADILGHEKTTMTYGVYSGGTSLRTKREAVELLSYPAARIRQAS